MRLLVCGGAGFIGSNFIRYFLAEHQDSSIVNLDLLTYAGNLDNLAGVVGDSRHEFVKGDICDRDLMMQISEGVDAIMNFAAETHVDRSIVDPQAFLLTDVLGTQVILDCVRERQISRFVHVSTDEVYGSIDEGSFTEESPINPSSPYSASKAGGDLICQAYHKTYGTPVIVTRASNNFGPNQYPEKVIPLFVTNLLEGKQVPLYGDGLNVRDWLYVGDHARALDVVLGKGIEGEIYNVGGGNEVSNLDLTNMILHRLGLGEEMIDRVPDRPGHDRRYSVVCDKLQALGWKPESHFEETLAQTIDWYKENEDWWIKIKHESSEFDSWRKTLYGSAS